MLHIIPKYNIYLLFYVDDTQLFFSFDPTSNNQLTTLRACINEVQTRLANDFLQLNEDKFKVIIICPEITFCHIPPQLSSFSTCITANWGNLGWPSIITSILISMLRQFSSILYQLCIISKILSFISYKNFKLWSMHWSICVEITVIHSTQVRANTTSSIKPLNLSN